MDDELGVMELLKMILKPVVPMGCQPVRKSIAFHRMWIIRTKDLFSVLSFVLILILVGCGGGSGTNSGGQTTSLVSTTVVSILVTPADPSVPVGVAKQFTASGTYSDGTSHDITTQATWSSSNTSVATVNGSGLATAVSEGTTTVTATLGSISGNTTLRVTSATLSSIAVTPANPSVPVGGAIQFAASSTYSDGTSHDISTQVTWSSSNTSVATVNGSGLATAASAGTTTVTATSGSISANMTLTVSSGGSGGMINLAWDPCTESGMAGYKVYYGTASRAYSNSTDVGNMTTYAITGLTKGQTYFIATTAYDTSGNGSSYSNEVSGVAK